MSKSQADSLPGWFCNTPKLTHHILQEPQPRTPTHLIPHPLMLPSNPWDPASVHTFALLRATIKTSTDRLVLQPQKLRSQNAKSIMTSKAITTFNQWQLRPLVCMASPLPPFWVIFRRNLLMCLVTPGITSGSTSVCPWLWPREMLPTYWPVCKFDLIFPVLFPLSCF